MFPCAAKKYIMIEVLPKILDAKEAREDNGIEMLFEVHDMISIGRDVAKNKQLCSNKAGSIIVNLVRSNFTHNTTVQFSKPCVSFDENVRTSLFRMEYRTKTFVRRVIMCIAERFLMSGCLIFVGLGCTLVMSFLFGSENLIVRHPT